MALEILPWTKLLTLIIWPKFKVSGPWNIGHEVMALVYSCWSHRPLIGLEILPWTKNLTWSSDGRKYRLMHIPECSMPPAGRGRGGIKIPDHPKAEHGLSGSQTHIQWWEAKQFRTLHTVLFTNHPQGLYPYVREGCSFKICPILCQGPYRHHLLLHYLNFYRLFWEYHIPPWCLGFR